MPINILTGNTLPSNPTSILGDVNIFASNGDAINLGQATMAASLPVVFASDQSPLPVSVTFPSTVAVTQSTTPWVISGSVSVSNFPATQAINLTQLSGATPSATNSLPSRISNGTVFVDPTQIRLLTATDQVTIANASIAVTGTLTVNQGTSPWVISGAVTGPLTDTQLRATPVPVSAASLPLPTGAATSALQLLGNASLVSIDSKLTSPLAVTQSGAWSVTATQGTSPWVTSLTDGVNSGVIKGAASPALAADASLVVALSPNSPLPTGSAIIGALVANQSVNLNQYGGVATTLGQKVMASSIPVTFASDQSALPVTGTFFQATQPVSIAGTVAVSGPLTDVQLRATPVPVSGTVTANLGTIAGVATETTLSAINAKVPALGQALAAASVPVVLTAAQLSTLTPLATVAVTQSTSPWVVNQTQLNGVAVSTGSGVSGTGTQRVVLATDQPTIPVNFSDGQQVDAFGRLRVSNPDTIFDNNFRNSLQPLLWSSSTATGGTVTHTPNSAAATLAVTATNASSAIYQTRRYFPYNAGKSQLIIFTGVIGAGQANTRKRYGYFDANDGIFFEQDGTTLEVVRRTSTSGAAVDNTVAQASWNLDPLNGTGASGFTLDVTKANIFFIDFEWLGVGRIRMGVANPNGGFIYCHQFINANQFTVPYMRTGSLPIRAEITNTAGAAAISTFDIICQTVISEGGNQRFGTQRSSSRGFTLRTVTTSYTPLISMRLKAANITAVAKLIETGVFGSTADNLNFSIIINPATLTGATWAVTTDGETVEVDIAATALTGGTVITNGYVNAAGAAPSVGTVSLETSLNTWFGSNLAGTADVFTLAARCSSGTADVAGFLTWLEL